ncbi:MAG TPA: hypothetical protein VMT18_04025 [Planctomycetota bacterium]|nr:hypothetical protein [Planctomycetota bacterium]
MNSSTLLTLAAAAILCGAPASAQSVQSSKIVIGDGLASRGSSSAYTQPDQGAFNAALAAIGGPSSSGTIEVMPGTYSFASTVQITKPGVRISGGPSAIVRLPAGFDGPLFQVRSTASDCILDGLTLLFEGDAADDGGRSLIDVVGHGFTMTNCRVVVSSSSTVPGIAPSTAVRIAPISGSYFGGALEGNNFVVGRVDDPNGTPKLVHAPGWRLIESNEGRNLRIQGNDFRSGRLALDETPVLLRNAVFLIDDQWTSVLGNTFSHLETSGPGAGAATALVGSLESAPGKESNHMTFTGNQISACRGPSNLCLEGAGFSSITGNTFDRLGIHSQATVLLQGTGGVTVAGNTFTNIGAVVGPSLRISNGTLTSIQGNGFQVPDAAGTSQVGPQVMLIGDGGALLCGNHFADALGTATQLSLSDAVECSVVGNRFQTSGCKPLQLTSGTPREVFVCGNLFELPDAGCSSPPWTASGYTVLQCDSNAGNPRF